MNYLHTSSKSSYIRRTSRLSPGDGGKSWNNCGFSRTVCLMAESRPVTPTTAAPLRNDPPSHVRNLPASAPGPQAKLRELSVPDGMESTEDGLLGRGGEAKLIIAFCCTFVDILRVCEQPTSHSPYTGTVLDIPTRSQEPGGGRHV
ncbi:hypothetical protein JB92DRAFT_732758 [Gautieria morchelliformis]|nr:hypothetical protein JB92DRAFT_732758 [Gautieria morchelliformis]